jgi:hypothetical protein
MATKQQHDRALAIANAIGAEPDCKELVISEVYSTVFSRLLNWYSANKDRKDSIKYTKEFVKKNDPTKLELLDELSDFDHTITFGWIARIVTRGGTLSPDHKRRHEEYLGKLYAQSEAKRKAKTVAAAPKKNVINIQEAMAQKIDEFIGNLEVELDKVFIEDAEFNLFNHMKAQQMPAAYIDEIREWSKGYLSRYLDVLKGEDQAQEAYSNFTKKKQKDLAKLFHSFIEDCDKYALFKKANKKPRAVREKTPAQQVKGIKFKVKDEELGITSVAPTEMIGASQVWLYNTKTKKLSRYTSDSTKGMQAKGSAIQNWNPDNSKQKTLRKPAEQIKELLESGKVKLRTFLDNVKAKEQDVNGRLNTDTIILKVIR